MLKPYLKEGRREAGCDEAGRGCLAGPVYAAAVILPPDIAERIASGESGLAALNDSKQLSEKQRYALRPIIQQEALAWAVGVCDNHEIDRLTGIITDLLTLTRMDNGNEQIQKETVDMSAMTAETVRMLTPAAEKRHLQRCHCPLSG